MEPLITNIFCIMGKPGAGKSTFIKNILSDKQFVNKHKICKLVYGTTRNRTPYDIDEENYHFYTNEEFENIDPDSIIESRSYDIIYTGETLYFFTLKDHIKFGTNYVGQISAFQYEELKKWAVGLQLRNSVNIRINLYPIMIMAPIFEREKRLMNKASNEQDVYNICSRIVSERYEFNTVIKNNPELVDCMNPNTCIIENGKMGISNQVILTDKIKDFISLKLIMQGM